MTRDEMIRCVKDALEPALPAHVELRVAVNSVDPGVVDVTVKTVPPRRRFTVGDDSSLVSIQERQAMSVFVDFLPDDFEAGVGRPRVREAAKRIEAMMIEHYEKLQADVLAARSEQKLHQTHPNLAPDACAALAKTPTMARDILQTEYKPDRPEFVCTSFTRGFNGKVVYAREQSFLAGDSILVGDRFYISNSDGKAYRLHVEPDDEPRFTLPTTPAQPTYFAYGGGGWSASRHPSYDLQVTLPPAPKPDRCVFASEAKPQVMLPDTDGRLCLEVRLPMFGPDKSGQPGEDWLGHVQRHNQGVMTELLAKVKRSLREFPICRFGGQVTAKFNGPVLVWSCNCGTVG